MTSQVNNESLSWDSQRGMEHGYGMEEEAKKDGKRWLFAQIVVISKFTQNPDSYPLIHLKKQLEEKKNQQWST